MYRGLGKSTPSIRKTAQPYGQVAKDIFTCAAMIVMALRSFWFGMNVLKASPHKGSAKIGVDVQEELPHPQPRLQSPHLRCPRDQAGGRAAASYFES